ncbi:hypothetical protein NDN08_001859 [Rhodosorus marinus]|uniref:Uncharacterized protein n=1 Tax=Rhodosorus marinus TaxID=101924 RepID=A0AAV8UWC5_9RHOD|nr:hypothetical protein NDN08_001859 [Rhodosorus marinus]
MPTTADKTKQRGRVSSDVEYLNNIFFLLPDISETGEFDRFVDRPKPENKEGIYAENVGEFHEEVNPTLRIRGAEAARKAWVPDHPPAEAATEHDVRGEETTYWCSLWQTAQGEYPGTAAA